MCFLVMFWVLVFLFLYFRWEFGFFVGVCYSVYIYFFWSLVLWLWVVVGVMDGNVCFRSRVKFFEGDVYWKVLFFLWFILFLMCKILFCWLLRKLIFCLKCVIGIKCLVVFYFDVYGLIYFNFVFLIIFMLEIWYRFFVWWGFC